MGLGDLVSKVISRYEADVSDHVRGLEKLKGAQREQAQGAIDAGKKTAEALEGHVKSLNKVQEAFQTVAAGARFAREAISHHVEVERLRAKSAGADIDALRRASNGLKNDMQLMAEAAKLQSGAFKLNNEQLAVAEKAMLAFTRKGHDQAEVTKKVTDAVTALKVDGLADLGVFVDKSGLSMENAADRGELFRRVMISLGAASLETADAQALAAEKAEQTAIRLENAFNKLKNVIGGVVAEAPGYIEKETRRGMRVVAATSGLWNLFGPDLISEDEMERRAGTPQEQAAYDYFKNAGVRGQNALFMGGDRSGFVGDALAGNTPTGATGIDLLELTLNKIGAQRYTRSANLPADWGASVPGAKPGGAGRIGGRAMANIENIWDESVSVAIGMLVGDAMAFISQEADKPTDNTAFELERFNALMGRAGASLRGTGDAMSAGDRYAAFNTKQAGSKLEAMFGPIEEFNAYKAAFDALSGAVGAAMTAWIDGSMSAGKAFKAFIAESVKAIAVQMAMEALKHGAFALGHLAFGDMIGAGRHGKAAAQFAAGAIVAAAAAKGLSGGGASSGAGAGAGAAAPIGGGGGGAPYRGTDRTIIVGDQFSDDSTRKRARTFRRREQEAYGSVGSVNR